MGDIYSAGEIVKKLKGVTTRQILDLAEKGLITPIRETTGAGSPRLYSFQNVFEICLCLAVRGRIPAGTATQELITKVLQFVREETRKEIEKKPKKSSFEDLARFLIENESGNFEPPPFDVLFIGYDDHDDYSFFPIYLNENIGEILATSKKDRPQNYCTYVIEVKKLWEYLDRIF